MVNKILKDLKRDTQQAIGERLWCTHKIQSYQGGLRDERAALCLARWFHAYQQQERFIVRNAPQNKKSLAYFSTKHPHCLFIAAASKVQSHICFYRILWHEAIHRMEAILNRSWMRQWFECSSKNQDEQLAEFGVWYLLGQAKSSDAMRHQSLLYMIDSGFKGKVKNEFFQLANYLQQEVVK